MNATTALLTDHYELTMLQASLADGTAHRRSVFELFARRLPDGRRYGVVAGVNRLLDALERFRFDEQTVAFLTDRGIVDQAAADWLADYRFTGDISGYADGEIFFPGSPVLIVESSFAEAVLLETVFLSILNHDSAVASAASRMTWWAGGRPCIEMGSRRTHEEAAVASALAAYIAGFATTSNVEAARRYGIPSAGTAAHAFTLLHDTERDAFISQVDALGKGTTLLVDTYDLTEAVAMAIDVAGTDLGAVRLDSGDLPSLAGQVRDQLDSLGATKTRIIVTSDLDEYQIAALAPAAVDGYGVGTSLVTGSGYPTCGFVYKLVAREDSSGALLPVAKKSPDKISIGGRKYALRRRSAKGVAEVELIGVGEPPVDDGDDRDLLKPLVEAGKIVGRTTPDESQAHHLKVRDELPRSASQLSRGEPAIPTEYIGDLNARNPFASRSAR
ncbi:nicotinate phosphoribosyltransferase [Kribbella orskensis]|uniref:Nicotinate phosphoribosyltransferase n=2 Tax=Kribbellaceae TaxID=2726069 RepID=A0ABY2BTV7_9ACTN|nr:MULTISPECIES: nicotinate phosphoribosyltransferase [Kribbella]TCN44542.1 nicotinate phosphoribosyltransferase [Kribbella sp. VKM Ac-2500]TCO31680.1 nicotinate phosphoribosyltransferase [Kribbella orskensis]